MPYILTDGTGPSEDQIGAAFGPHPLYGPTLPVYVGNEDQADVVTDEDETYEDTDQEEDVLMGAPTGESDAGL